ncbi:hypothetical protein WCE41_03195 [Luteimonas sp. MJ246]|uniref:hypothetical protein n=1 Tax=Luteimonas sp. MJ174 TaxID=3129237 RepID=UPI0031BA6729
MSAVKAAIAAPEPSPHYTIHSGDVERDRDAILAIWGDHFGPLAMQPDKYDHFYRDSPHGPPIIQLLRHQPDGALVGVIGAGPRPMYWRGQPLRAAVVAHFAVTASHRSLGPALLLQQALVEAARGRFDLLYGLPRPGAVGVSRRAGFGVMGELVRHAKVLRHGAYLRRRLPATLAHPLGAILDTAGVVRDRVADGLTSGLHWRWSAASDPAMDGLWHSPARPGALASVRGHAAVQWRFDLPPAGRARYLLVSDGDGTLLAWFACDAEDRPGDPLQVLDYWSADALTGLSRPLVRALAAAARAQRRPAIHLLLAATPAALAGWRAEGFVARSSQPIIGLWLGDALAPAGRPDLHMTWLDQDG